MYDANDSVVGFEYSQINEMDGKLKTTRIYYEKNLQGDVIGLLDSRGAEIAVYAYDAWGNIITDNEESFCYEGYEVPFELNHILYRGYYYDGSCNDAEGDTNLYYLQSRYYDAEVGRFINADDTNMLEMQLNSMFKDNLYCYCNSNPVNYDDASGLSPRWWHLAKGTYLIGIGLNMILKLYKKGFVRAVLSAVSTKILIYAARVAIVLMALQQYIAVIANIITIVSIVLTVKKLTLNIPTGLWHLKQSIWHNHK